MIAPVDGAGASPGRRQAAAVPAPPARPPSSPRARLPRRDASARGCSPATQLRSSRLAPALPGRLRRCRLCPDSPSCPRPGRRLAHAAGGRLQWAHGRRPAGGATELADGRRAGRGRRSRRACGVGPGRDIRVRTGRLAPTGRRASPGTALPRTGCGPRSTSPGAGPLLDGGGRCSTACWSRGHRRLRRAARRGRRHCHGPGAARAREAVASWPTGWPESPPEIAAAACCSRCAGLPSPSPSSRVCDDGRAFVARVDLAYPEQRIAIEYDGAWHGERGQFAQGPPPAQPAGRGRLDGPARHRRRPAATRQRLVARSGPRR